MVTLLQTALSNAVAATGLAVLAALAGWLVRRPPLTRALWVLVLLKLVTPPIWHVNVPRPAQRVEVPRQNPVETRQAPSVEIPFPTDLSLSEIPAVEQPSVTNAAPARVQTLQQSPRASYLPAAARYWPIAVAGLWALGIVVHLFFVFASVVRLRRLTRRAVAVDAPTLARAQTLARQLGLRHCPRVLFAQGPISPMLCAINLSPRLLLPAELWRRLDARQRDTVLTHELAHLKRRDHWVRALEVLVTAAYWWHPVVWWARRALREATEQCCDAWVLWALPRSAASYATALIEAIDFISTARPVMPALASGMGQFTDLKRRLVMIKRGTAGKALSWPALGAVCTLGGLVLPLAPTFAQVANSTSAAVTSAPEGGEVAPVPAATATVSVAPEARTSELSVTSVEAANATPAAGGVASVETRPETSDSRAVNDARREVERLRAQLARAEDRLARIEGRRAGRNGNTTAQGQYTRAFGLAGGAAGPRTEVDGALNRIGAAAAGENQQQRLDALEGQVREILNELRQMKREQRNSNRNTNENQAK